MDTGGPQEVNGEKHWKVPEGYEWYRLQIAGHHHDRVKNGVRQIGILKNKKNGRLLKPVQSGVRGLSEVGLYGLIFALRRKQGEDDSPIISDDPVLSGLARFVPTFFGTVPISLGDQAHLFMELEDVTSKYRHPCVVDLKIGLVTFDPSANQDKVAHEKQKYPQQSQTGFRFLGMKKFDPKTMQMETKDKHWGYTLKQQDIPGAFDYFVAGRHAKYQQKVCDGLVKSTKVILAWFERQKRFHFYASSLLLVYEGDEIAAATDDKPICDVRMIDFAHVVDANNSSDANYLSGLKAVIKQLEGLKKRVHQR